MAEINKITLEAAWADGLIRPDFTDNQQLYLPKTVVLAGQILKLLKENSDGLNLEQLVNRIQLNPNTIKIYARYLATKGMIEIQTQSAIGGPNLYFYLPDSEKRPTTLIRAVLPDPKYFKEIAETEAWPYQWEAKESHFLRVRSKIPNPWQRVQVIRLHEAKGRGRHSSGVSRLDLDVQVDQRYDPRFSFQLVFDSMSGMAYSVEPTHRFYALKKTGRTSGYLTLSVVRV